MRYQRKVAISLALALVIGFSMFTGYTSQAEAAQPAADQMAKYDPSITVNTFFEIAPPLAPYFSEDRIKTNIWAREYEEVLGIKLNFLWFANESADDSIQPEFPEFITRAL